MATTATQAKPAKQDVTRAHSRTWEIVSVVAFIGAITGSNILVGIFGPWILPITAFFMVGVTLVTRDYLHDIWSDRAGTVGLWARMLSMFVIAAILSYLSSDDMLLISIASISALVGSSIVETLVFSTVLHRKWGVRSPSSNVAGAVMDATLFPLIAFGVEGVGGWGAFLSLIATQMLLKAAGGMFWTLVYRYTINPDKLRDQRRARREQLRRQQQVAAVAATAPEAAARAEQAATNAQAAANAANKHNK